MSAKKGIGLFVAVMVMALIGIVFIQQMFDTAQFQTNTVQATNETSTFVTSRIANNDIDPTVNLTILNANKPTVTGKGAITSFTMTNASGFPIGATNYTVDLNSGNFSMLNTTFLGSVPWNATLLNYVYQDENYVSDGASRSIIVAMLLLAVVALVIFVIVPFMKSDYFERIKNFRYG